MNRRLFFLGLSGLAGCTRASRPRLNVFNWSDYVAPETIPNFEKEFGAEVRYATYESNEEMLAKVFGGNSGWDVVFPSSTFIRPMIENGLLGRLDLSLLPNAANLAEDFRSPKWDPKHEWCLPFMWGTTGIVHQRSVRPPLEAWADLWDQRLSGRITMLDDPQDCIGAALKKIHAPWNSADPNELNAAGAELLKQKPLLRAYLNAEAQDQLVAGDILAAETWATVAQRAMEASSELLFAYPLEGYSRYADTIVVLKESKRHELAHAFVNYMMRPEVAAPISIYTKTATSNGAAEAILPPEIRENPTLYPDDTVLARAEWSEALPASAQRLRDRIWTQVKSA